MDQLIDTITGAFLSALQTGGQSLARYGLPLLSVLALISYYRTFGTHVLQGYGSLSDALGAPLLFCITVGGYYYLVVHLFDLAQAALQTVFQWGLEASGQAMSPADLQRPSFIMTYGMQAAAPVAAFSNWWDTMASVVKLASSPSHLVAFWFILIAFALIMVHHMAMLIEYQAAVMCTAVLLPWGLWTTTASVAEFALGWVTGGAIRALVSTALLGIALPLFPLLTETTAGGWSLQNLVIPQALTLAIGAFIFCVLCWWVPARAATMAGRATLAITGSTFAAGAMTFARFGMVVSSVGGGIIRGTSQMLQAGR